MKRKSEARKKKRQSCCVPVDGKLGATRGTSLTVDISESGLGLMAERSVPVGKKIAVEIEISPQEEPLLFMGKVLWVQKLTGSQRYRLGMKFANSLFPESRTRLRDFFSRFSPDSSSRP